jgi:predicted cupin superfamily sugar epimerase
MNKQDIINKLNLLPHPEGGHYRQTWVAENKGRPTGTCIYFLLGKDEHSHWHSVDATEIWLFHCGAPIVLSISPTATGPTFQHILTADLTKGVPQLIVPDGHWQTAHCTGDWSLVSCTVSPGFQFDGFTLASPEFEIAK